jgi:hypothetical protein
MMKRLVPFVFAASVLASSTSALAQSSNAAIAEAAFKRGKELMAENKPAEACPKFEESHRLDPSVGALLNLGRCYEQLGQTASAWVRYKEAATLARTLGQTERETVARDLATALEPKLSRVRIDATSRVQGMRITRNNEEVGIALLGDALPVDPGQLKVEVTAPGYKPWSTTIEIGKEADLKTVLIPALTVDPKSPSSPGSSGSSGLRTTAFVVGGVGVAALGAGAVFGGLAVKDKGEADALCPNKSCNSEGFAHIEAAKNKALISTISIGVGAGAVAAGVVLFIVSRPSAPPKDSARRTWIVPTFGPQAGGAAVIGTF